MLVSILTYKCCFYLILKIDTVLYYIFNISPYVSYSSKKFLMLIMLYTYDETKIKYVSIYLSVYFGRCDLPMPVIICDWTVHRVHIGLGINFSTVL